MKGTLKDLLRGSGGLQHDPDQPLSPLNKSISKPTVILVSGVNGTGKTTSIAKLAKLVQTQGNTVMLAAGDTFRAAAVEQLNRYGVNGSVAGSSRRRAAPIPQRSRSPVAKRPRKAGVDYLIIDTAGRLHTQQNLMKELEKVRRVVEKRLPGAPQESLLVIDATTGQNGIQQALTFSKAIQCTGIVLTKLDRHRKGGVVVAIRQQMGLPVKYVGVGEQIDDLQVFDPDQFVEALFSEE